MDESNDPLYPFGYGLSYTQFQYSDLKADKISESSVKVSVTVKNVGAYNGEEVAQLYLRDYVASVARPVKELRGFQKIYLEKGESKQLEFVLKKEELGFYNLNGEFVFEPGKFKVMLGGSSDAELALDFTL